MKQFSHHSPAARGFTLLEVLAALSLFGIVAGLLASGVAQAMRIADRSGASLAESRDLAVRTQWFRESVSASFAIGSRGEDGIQGTTRTLAGRTSIGPENEGALGRYRYEIGFDAARGRAQLELVTAAGQTTRRALFDWPGSAGAFRYLDEEGEWHGEWPPRRLTADIPSHAYRSTLPVAVELLYTGRDGRPASLIAGIRDRAPPPPTHRQFVQ